VVLLPLVELVSPLDEGLLVKVVAIRIPTMLVSLRKSLSGTSLFPVFSLGMVLFLIFFLLCS